MKRGAFVAFAAFAFALPASAQIAAFNTGVDASGDPLAGGSSDPNWTVVSGPGITDPTPAVVLSNQMAGTYVQDDDSRWIWVNAGGAAATNESYTFRLTFDLTGFDPDTAVISGRWGVDNLGEILLNGATPTGTGTFEFTTTDQAHFNQFHEFSITGGFVEGVNTLDFVLTDTGNPAGFNVTDLTATAVVPEPASLLALGAGALGLASRRKRR